MMVTLIISRYKLPLFHWLTFLLSKQRVFKTLDANNISQIMLANIGCLVKFEFQIINEIFGISKPHVIFGINIRNY